MVKGLGLFFTALLLLKLFVWATPADNSSALNYLPQDLTIDSVVVHKSAHQMVVFSHNQPIKVYRVHLGLCPKGPKQFEGDYKTPEGLYFINSKNANSSFHKSLGISYPNAQDIARAQHLGKKPGGDILIHGLPNGEEHVGPKRYQNDWTWGCVAISDPEIDELFQHVKTGTSILITP
jgi:murein L,D-transpeptidase YafK